MRALLVHTPDPIVAEVGVGIGATTLAMCQLLDNRGELYLFDFDDSVTTLREDVRNLGFTNVRALGNSRRTYDSYAWTLARLLEQRLAAGDAAIFDFVYLDGGHAFHLDAPAAVLLKDLLKPGATLLFDDVTWTFGKSPTQNPHAKPETAGQFTQEQIETPHVRLVCELLFDRDPRFRRVPLDVEHRRAYVKTQ